MEGSSRHQLPGGETGAAALRAERRGPVFVPVPRIGLENLLSSVQVPLRRSLLRLADRLETIQHVVHVGAEEEPAVRGGRRGTGTGSEAEALPDDLSCIDVSRVESTAANRVGK